MESISVQYTKEELRKIRKLAKEESRSVSAQVRHLTRKALGEIK